MKKTCIISALLCLTEIVPAQKGIEGLIQAEKNFAAYSVSHGAKEAFLQYMDSSSLVFDEGKAVKGIEFWEKKKASTAVLNWRPQYAEISGSGDFGYTTGPWTYQPGKNDTVIARGQYTTVWHINKSGEWKFLVDLGTSYELLNSSEEVIRINTVKVGESREVITHVFPMVAAENDFLRLFRRNKTKAWKKYLSEESVMNRNGHLPAGSEKDRRKIIKANISADTLSMDGWAVSPDQDMGFTYGNMMHLDKKENYLHIWRREKSGWKIALEVLRY